MDVEPRLVAATLEQLAHRREIMVAGGTRVGWKLGMGERERIGASLAVGHLTSATQLGADGTYRVGGLAADLRADIEVAVELHDDVDWRDGASALLSTIAGYAAALEVVDLAPVLDRPEAIIATNVFHRAVAFGPMQPSLPREAQGLRAAVRVNGEQRVQADVDTDLAQRLLGAARILDAVDERLAKGDRVITGSIIQISIRAGDEVRADIGPLGSVCLKIDP